MSSVQLQGNGKTSLFELLGGRIPGSSCGGNGTCGKCRVRVLSPVSAPSAADRRFLEASELARGFRIACHYFPADGCTVEIELSPSPQAFSCDNLPVADRYRIVSSYKVPPFKPSGFIPDAGIPEKRYGIGVDIGTTTIAMELTGLDDGCVYSGASLLNSQRRFGADVLSRIQAAVDGNAEELRLSVISDILGGMSSLLAEAGITADSIALVTVAANTTMIHLLLGLPCVGLGTAPFTPAATVFSDTFFRSVFAGSDLLSGFSDCPVRIVPCISAFVGGDIVSGLGALELTGKGGAELFLDLGTNAEMVVVSEASYWCASASAGPAFEGGNISCGTGSVPGAVSAIHIEGNSFAWELVGADIHSSRLSSNKNSPVGICGSGLLDFVACALDAGLIEKDGALSPVCAESGIFLDKAGRIRLLASDVREFQLAKAAIRAGISVLLAAAGLREENIVRVYLAGGFGQYLKEASALTVGLLPRAFAGKITASGNTSLAGAVRFLSDETLSARFDAILQKSISVSLAGDPGFGGLFIGAMEFGE